MSLQLSLGVQLRADATFDNFYAGDNQELVSHLIQVARGQSETSTYLWGGVGVGRTHLLQACCHDAGLNQRAATYLPLTDIKQFKPEILEGMESLALVCIDNIHNIVGKRVWEEALFHLYNRVTETDTRLVIAGRHAPRDLGLGLLDLSSRLASGVLYQVHPLTDEDKLAAIHLQARARGLQLPSPVAQYILTHCSRNMTDLTRLLSELDDASLSQKRKLSIPLVKEVLAES